MTLQLRVRFRIHVPEAQHAVCNAQLECRRMCPRHGQGPGQLVRRQFLSPILVPLNIRCRNIIHTQKVPMILRTTQVRFVDRISPRRAVARVTCKRIGLQTCSDSAKLDIGKIRRLTLLPALVHGAFLASKPLAATLMEGIFNYFYLVLEPGWQELNTQNEMRKTKSATAVKAPDGRCGWMRSAMLPIAPEGPSPCSIVHL